MHESNRMELFAKIHDLDKRHGSNVETVLEKLANIAEKQNDHSTSWIQKLNDVDAKHTQSLAEKIDELMIVKNTPAKEMSVEKAAEDATDAKDAKPRGNCGKNKENILNTLVSDYLNNMNTADREELRTNVVHRPKFTLGEVLDHERLNCASIVMFLDG